MTETTSPAVDKRVATQEGPYDASDERVIAIEVPERPMLAPDVFLVGEMQGSGFQDQQWLIQRGGQFLQVPELLYRVAERADGERTLDQIATGVTEATEWLVSADNVRQIIAAKLVPLGVIATAASVQLAGMQPVSTGRDPSLLALNMRMRLVGPRFIDPFTRVLQFFFAPPLLIPMLVTIVAAHLWLFRTHDIVHMIRVFVYTPGLLLAALAITVASNIFHEFGHASALRYGGGKVRGMGAGFYLIFPALYTDTTDSYRLGRWARVRTDLGGFYFHLIFALGIVGLYLLSGREFLLVIVLLIDLQIVGQCIPFVRFDGYWALADLTGIPDFFSQIGPFVRNVLPIDRAHRSALPPLKPWVKRFFALYILLAIPIIGLLYVLMIRSVPRVTAFTWDAFLIQRQGLFHPQGPRTVLGTIVSLVQMIILPLPLLGVVYLLCKVGWTIVHVLWRWSRHIPVRQVASMLGVIGSLALVAHLWIPQLPFAQKSEPPGVQHFAITERAHVLSPVAYPQTPPVGGNHMPIWQNCGFYDAPIANEFAVHSLEHGAVWITYRLDLGKEEVDVLHHLAARETYVLVSPFPDLPAPIVASAWGRQLRLDSAADPRLGQFVRAFRLGKQAPERGGPCMGGIGSPR